jgi:hypothetical protein
MKFPYIRLPTRRPVYLLGGVARFRLLARFCRTGLVTRRVSTKGFTFEMILLSRASWRKDTIPNSTRQLSIVSTEPQQGLELGTHFVEHRG